MIDLTENGKKQTLQQIQNILLSRVCLHLHKHLNKQAPGLVKPDAVSDAVSDALAGLATQFIRSYVESIELTDAEKVEVIKQCCETLTNMSVSHLSELLEVNGGATDGTSPVH